MSLFEKFTKKKADDTLVTTPPAKPAAVDSSATSTSEEPAGYYFQSVTELALYGKLYGKDKRIYWLKGTDYIDTYNRGFHLFEQGKFQEALNAYRDSLKLNPIGISARFEICETYIKMKQYDNARKTLLEMKEYLIESENIARFYRRLGFIATEEGNYDCAIAAYTHSLNFKNTSSARDELEYIRSISKMSKLKVSSVSKNAVHILIKNGIPMLVGTDLR